MEPLQRISQIFAAIRKPYEPQQLAELEVDQRKLVFQAEIDLFLKMLSLDAYESNKQAAHARNIFFDDKDRIDLPLSDERTLIRCYLDTGLAKGESAAKLMVQRFKTYAKEQIRPAPEISGR